MRSKRAYHTPNGNPCRRCGLPASVHSPSHKPTFKTSLYPRCDCGADAERHKYNREYLVGLDGEGYTNSENNHVYNLLAWSDATGDNHDHIRSNSADGLTTEECLDFLLKIPANARPFAYAFNYDLTMLLRDVDDKLLYLLFRPEKRAQGSKSIPVKWRDYSLNLMGTKFTVKRGSRTTVIWDTFRFYQSKFTEALRTWKVDDVDVARMEGMKAARGNFTPEQFDQVLEYCLDECRAMARLTRKLIDAHKAAGLPLKSFYGAGSTASVLLKQMGIHEIKRDGPEEMKVAVATAFFGGRFENRVAGPVPGKVYSYDISSAYPYQLFNLPCLECGEWMLSAKHEDIYTSTTALVRYSLTPKTLDRNWGPLPFRLASGSIVFPGATTGGGWVWSSEFIQAEKHWRGVNFHEAWCYKTACNHKPFAPIAQTYVERLKLGKDGPGIVLKLGPNSCYGKLAQSVGRNRPFRSMIWAGMVTAGCRAQQLEMIGLHKNRANCLMIATDGLYSREKLNCPKPIETGTNIGIWDEKKKETVYKPLGGWEEKELENGIFAARPGIYFPLQASDDDVAAFRARGIGRKELYANFRKIMAAWDKGMPHVDLGEVVRFHGAKSSISVRAGYDGGPVALRADRYGQWRPRPIRMSFNPLPKRDAIREDGSLTIRTIEPGLTSVPYKRAFESEDEEADLLALSPEARELRITELELLEQPQ